MDLNCDLGENEPLTRTRGLMRWITSANIACGGHAGDAAHMAACLRLCARHQVRAGAHPGFPDRGRHGRGQVSITPAELRLLLLHQVGALGVLAAAEGVLLTHIKLHGSLYHATDLHPPLARAYLDTVREFWPQAVVYARIGGGVARMAKRFKVEVWPEAFADRRYRPDGTLVPRDEPGALLENLHDVRAQALAIEQQGKARTLCLHGDTPAAPILARNLSRWLKLR